MNYDDMKRMQAAAERRVSEMDRRSRFIVDSINGSGGGQRPECAECGNFKPVRDVPVPKNIKMPVEFSPPPVKNTPERTVSSEKPHFVYEPTPRPVSGNNGGNVRPNGGTNSGGTNRSGNNGGEIRRTNIYGGSGGSSNFLGNLSKDDTERLFLLSLCMLLKNENADEELITALMYIMT